jgi:heme exporter protein C
MSNEKLPEKMIFISSRIMDYLLPLILLPLLPLALFYSFVIAPDEKILGSAQRILYFHVGSAFSAYLMLGVLFVCSIFYLVFRAQVFFQISRSAALPAFIFSTIVLLSGMLWGYSSWNTWWNWEPRLVSMLLLWVFLLSWLYLQSIHFDSQEVRAVVSSVLGVLCALQVPLVVFSIKLLDRTQQLHPEVVAVGGLTVPEYRHAMVISSLALMLLSVHMCRIYYRTIRLEDRLNIAQRKIIMKSKENGK